MKNIFVLASFITTTYLITFHSPQYSSLQYNLHILYTTAWLKPTRVPEYCIGLKYICINFKLKFKIVLKMMATVIEGSTNCRM